MDLSDASFDNLVHMLYEAVERPAAWSAFYTALGQTVDAGSVQLLAMDKQHGALSYSDGFNLPTEGELAYLQKYSQIDPRMQLVLQLEPGKWLHCHETFNDDFVKGDPFYQEFLIPIGLRYVSGTKLVEDERACVVFCILMPVGSEPLGEASILFLERLTPHLTRAARMQMQTFVFSTKALVGHALVNKMRQPVMLLTTDGSVVLTNEAANRLLGSTPLIGLIHGKLVLPANYHQPFLDECSRLEGLARAGDLSSDAADSRYHSVAIAGPVKHGVPQERLYAFFTLLVPPQVSGAFGLRPLVMLLFYHPESAPPIDSDVLTAAFNLTPAEARVSRLLGEGMSPKEIAIQLGTQHETVRKQLLSIYRKTATNRQSELMRLMLHLPLNAFD